MVALLKEFKVRFSKEPLISFLETNSLGSLRHFIPSSLSSNSLLRSDNGFEVLLIQERRGKEVIL